MKRFILFVILTFILSLTLNAQKGKGPGHGMKFREKIEQLEKLKLIEVLDLDEETTLRFFARQNQNRDEVMNIMEQKEELVEVLRNHFTSGKDLPNGETFKSLNKKISEFEKKMVETRTDFYSSLKDLLSEEQISKLIVFESSFRREIRDMILDKRGIEPPMPR